MHAEFKRCKTTVPRFAVLNRASQYSMFHSTVFLHLLLLRSCCHCRSVPSYQRVSVLRVQCLFYLRAVQRREIAIKAFRHRDGERPQSIPAAGRPLHHLGRGKPVRR
jgi:hypothetical protein